MEAKEPRTYDGMGIFQEARQRKIDGMGYRARRFKLLWQSKACTWQHLSLSYGIRWSEKQQFFPIWNLSNNCNRELNFGLGKLYFAITYARASPFNQDRKLFLRETLYKFYQLVS